ncbi:MAG: DUF2220 domain-containing protein [Lachnospiraceae bacterium]|nr:DUF2220 domain-containing protein [Lachnospiraceae bacterium]
MDWEEKILTYLVESYRRSKKDSGDNRTNRRTQVKPEKLYKKYKANDGDYDIIEAFNQTVFRLSEKGYVTYTGESFGTQILSVYLVDERLQEIEGFLQERYGYVTKEMQLQEAAELIARYESASPVCAGECGKLRELLNARRLPKDCRFLDAVFRAVAFIEHNQETLYLREASMKIYGDSKALEDSALLSFVCGLLREYKNRPCEDDEQPDEILKDYHISREPQKLCFKGKLVLTVAGKELDLGAFSCGIELMASELPAIDSVKILAPRFMTVENRTSYLRYRDEHTVVFYLGGYANRYQREFIKKVFEQNPGIEYLHFGDIDAGGFWIHHNLCEITGVPFSLFHMSAEELQNREYEACLHRLSKNDIARLGELRRMALYADVVSYMLEHNVKREQEIVSLDLMGNERKEICSINL